ncbi:MAG: hypothetical protein JW749_10595 [Sedimentisphaerales bacterium]|nr:hypothetical protein [Sedimentisphaerales bacterium]
MPIADPVVFVNDEMPFPGIITWHEPSEEVVRKAGLTMAAEEQVLGLCSTCNSKDVCLQRKNIKFPVLYCEEFDDSTALSAKVPKASGLPEKKPDLDTSMGLCCNCGNRDTCTLRRTPGGIWHCEEYC